MAYIRSDKDGAFIWSTKFCKMTLQGLGVALQSMGGYASMINIKAKAFHKTTKRMSRVMLMGASMSDVYW